MKLSVSLSTYNEIAELLEKHGISTAEKRELILEKGTQLEAPVSYKLVTIRRDAAGIAAQAYEHDQGKIGNLLISVMKFTITSCMVKK